MNAKHSPKIFSITLAVLICCSNYLFAYQAYAWNKIDEGLFVGEFVSPQKSAVGDTKIMVIRVDPKIYAFKLLCASEMNHPNLTVKEWVKKYKLIGAINAGMFQTDYKSNVGYMKNYNHLNNPRINSGYKSVAAFNPSDRSKPEFRIYDIDDNDIKKIIEDYNIIIQNLRLIKMPAENRWSQQDRRWSEAALGQDKAGNVLLIFSRAPFSMYDFNNILIKLPINIVAAQHLEGGPEASLYFFHNNEEIEAVGSYETGFVEDDNNNSYWSIPNVIGFVKKH